MRILVAHNVPRARQGGMSRIMGFIHDEIARDGHEVEYLTSEDLPPRWRGAAARVAFPALVARRVAAAARADRPYDVVNVHEPSGAVAALLRRIGRFPPLVVTSHGLERRAWALARDQQKMGRTGPSLRARLTYPPTVLAQARAALAWADRVFVLNEDDAAYLARVTGRAPVTILRIFPAAASAYAAASHGRSYGDVRHILFAGTWRTNKGIADLVPAMQTIWRRHPDVGLTILGAGVPIDLPATFGARAGNVRLVAAASDEEAAAVFAAADLFVLPSLFEGTPLTLMEAMASGLPVVTTRVCGMKDVITDARNGLLVSPGAPPELAAAIERLMADPVLRARLGGQARTDAARLYTWSEVARPVLEAYKSLV